MKNKHLFAAMTACLFFVIFMVYPCHAENFSREQIGEFGFIDWLNQRVYATGIGIFPKNNTNTIQAKAMAQRAALVVAQRNLLGVINGVHIDSKTVVENRISQDDAIVAKIKGIVRFCQVEDTRMLNNRSVEVMVSMPLHGRLGKILIDVIEETAGQAGPRPSQEGERRLRDLENRVRILEQRISDLKKASVQKQDLIRLFQHLSVAWQTYVADRAAISHAGYASDAETAAIRSSLSDQERRLAAMSVHMEDISRRLVSLETIIDDRGTVQPVQPSEESTPYTGLIVDARRTNFKPCLKPSLFINGETIYPGNYLDINKAVKEGYVRYYSDPGQAQHSGRIGSLPYVVEATGTYEGDRGLSLGNSAYHVLKSVLRSPNNFLAQARVVIVF